MRSSRAPKKPGESSQKMDQFVRRSGHDGAAPSSPSSIPAEDASETAFAPILAAIATCQTTLTTHIEEVKIDLSLIKVDLQAVRERTTAVEARVSALEDMCAPVPAQLTELQQQIKQQASLLDDYENRQRRNNVRVVGLPEGAEGNSPTDFAERWLKQLLPNAPFTTHYTVERAHRVPGRPRPPGAPPRPFLIRLLHFRDRDASLSEARSKGQLVHEGANISLYPDYSTYLQKQRSTFTGVKRQLRDLKLVYAMLYPAKLKVIDANKSHFFNTPEEALSWIEARSGRGPRP
ncbi:uncharacterized protein LOC121400993 [Xenopus laevis]|uniref:Uncharacterized protein LOC121400993 n=1 Tax=Xenopus laevis TaxID=8355 RepID=A0A8J1MII0_XENLA|nr:uncharacterized protein LOC121400993 [Xenopus laevis]XP_041441304.1 uncharacterized protein LOC121400993 [Xenopus laevis]